MVRLRVCTLDASGYDVEVPDSSSLSAVREAIEAVAGIPCASQKLIVGNEVLSGSCVISSEMDGKTVLVTCRRIPPGADARPVVNITQKDVDMYTKQDPEKTKEDDRDRAEQYASSVRDLVATLRGVHVAAGPAASAAPKVLPPMNEDALQMIVGMGFPEEHARKALYLARMDAESAIQYLLVNGEDDGLNSPLTAEEIQRVGVAGEAGTDADASFVPNLQSLQRLSEMGFPENEVADALEACGNDEERAAAWLLGDRQQRVTLDASNPVIRAIMTSPIIQAGLQNARTFRAFHHIVEDPSSALEYINDPEIGPVLVRIHAIISGA